MALKERLDAELETALQGKDELTVSVVRLLKSAIKYREIEIAKALEDSEIHGVIAAEIKRRRDSVEQHRAGNRPELADREEAEIRVLQGWLPEQRGTNELRARD